MGWKLSLTHASRHWFLNKKKKREKKTRQAKNFFLQLNCVINKIKFHVYFTVDSSLRRLSQSLSEKLSSPSRQPNEIYFCNASSFRFFRANAFRLPSVFFLMAKNTQQPKHKNLCLERNKQKKTIFSINYIFSWQERKSLRFFRSTMDGTLERSLFCRLEWHLPGWPGNVDDSGAR